GGTCSQPSGARPPRQRLRVAILPANPCHTSRLPAYWRHGNAVHPDEHPRRGFVALVGLDRSHTNRRAGVPRARGGVLFRAFWKKTSGKPALQARSARSRLGLESLEGRCVPTSSASLLGSTATVGSTAQVAAVNPQSTTAVVVVPTSYFTDRRGGLFSVN